MTEIFIILALLIMLTSCSSTIDDVSLKPITRNEESSAKLIIETINTETATEKSPVVIVNFTSEPSVIITVEPTKIATPIATITIVPKVTPTVVITTKPKEVIKEPTPKPTLKPVAGEGYMEEMTSASPSYINSVLSAINKKRKANRLDNAILENSISASCKSHAKSMASSGNAYHSSNVVGCEGVSRNHYSMPAGTLGSAMVAHVGQLATSDTSKIGIGIIYYGNYMYVCIRGVG